MPSTRPPDEEPRLDDDRTEDAVKAEEKPVVRRRVPERGLSRDQLRALTDEIHQRKHELQTRRRTIR